jgi:hypothetical protein
VAIQDDRQVSAPEPPPVSGDDLLNLMAECYAAGTDPVPILVETLRELGYTVHEPGYEWYDG